MFQECYLLISTFGGTHSSKEAFSLRYQTNESFLLEFFFLSKDDKEYFHIVSFNKFSTYSLYTV